MKKDREELEKIREFLRMLTERAQEADKKLESLIPLDEPPDEDLTRLIPDHSPTVIWNLLGWETSFYQLPVEDSDAASIAPEHICTRGDRVRYLAESRESRII